MNKVIIIIDGVVIEAKRGSTILQAAEAAGVYIPRLCYTKGLKQPIGSCRVCSVKVNGRYQAACTQPVAEGQIIENDSEVIQGFRKKLLEMLFIEGNHYCMFCEKSGHCELQALAYRLGIMAPEYPYMFPKREVDGSHPEILIDRNRCVLCGRCVQLSKDVDGKNVFQFVGRSGEKRVAVNAEALLSDTDVSATDRAIEMCPVGALLKKHEGYKVPIGQRPYDAAPIGSEIEAEQRSENG